LALITDRWTELNAELHQRMPEYGRGGEKWAETVRWLTLTLKAESILDYGCGKGTLALALPEFDIREYDPAIPEKARRPKRADLVVCTDVLEHVERTCVTDVIDDLRRLSRRGIFINVSLSRGKKRLADGRPAHATVRTKAWWQEELSAIGKWQEITSRWDAYAAWSRKK
jgi:2-polyprenyl-3-methyl-5-hydroxy-6-metoxy-1,4-benzoquinol methylase